MDESVSHLSNGGPLFVGSLPARQPDAYYALLPVRVPKMAKVSTLGIPDGSSAANEACSLPSTYLCEVHVPSNFCS